jgi:hypothetical protein
MGRDVALDLEELGRVAAESVAAGGVEQVEVESGEDSYDRPAYFFSFLIDQGLTRMRPGLLYTRLVQKLRDDLVARGDDHFAVIRIFNREDWGRRSDARPN